jgi:hypothetical protein
VTVLYACESGSRAWGFVSMDSDYDVRFLYLRPPSWYLAVDLEHKRDVIERPIDGSLDVSGWDLRKALQLFRKSNPPLLEWLGSPIVYREAHTAAHRLRELASRYCSPTACSYHYLHMARGNLRGYLMGDRVKRKKYFYVLRPLLAIRWLQEERGVVPTEFSTLVETLLEPGELRDAIDRLVAEKAAGAELDLGPRIDVISDFIEGEMERYENARFARRPPTPPVAPLDELFQAELAQVYGAAVPRPGAP